MSDHLPVMQSPGPFRGHLSEEMVLQLFQLWRRLDVDLCTFQPEPPTFPFGFVRPVIHWWPPLACPFKGQGW